MLATTVATTSESDRVLLHVGLYTVGTMNVNKRKHHEREELCTTRPRYRQGRKLTAVKVDLLKWFTKNFAK